MRDHITKTIKETIHAKGVETDLYRRFSNEFISFIDCQI